MSPTWLCFALLLSSAGGASAYTDAAIHARVNHSSRNWRDEPAPAHGDAPTPARRATSPAPAVRPAGASRCAEGCAARGTCNEELGRCDCPPFWTGPTCAESAAPACRLTAEYTLPCDYNAASAHPLESVLTCDCLDQCSSALAAAALQGPQKGMEGLAHKCLDTRGQPSAAFLDAPQSLPQYQRSVVVSGRPGRKEYRVEWKPVKGPDPEIRPLSNCSDQCSFHGWCVQRGNKPAPECRCFWGYAGATCAEPVPTFCPSNCSGRGTCLPATGFCHCQPGSYGADCSLVWDPSEQRARLYWQLPSTAQGGGERIRPAVYVYDVPPAFYSWPLSARHSTRGDFGRNLPFAFHDRLMNSMYRTADPAEADYFFVPCLGGRSESCTNVIAYIRQRWPFWNSSSRPDHLAIGTDDIGSNAYFKGADSPKFAQERDAKLIWLQHMGYLQDPSMRGRWDEKLFKSLKPHQDINIPAEEPSKIAVQMFMEDRTEAEAQRRSERRMKRLLFYAGAILEGARIRPNPRWELKRALAADPHPEELHLADTTKGHTVEDYTFGLETSLFCFAPPGKDNGYGNRFAQAVLAGCLPVFVSDDYSDNFGEFLPMAKMSVPVALAGLPALTERLRAIRDDPPRLKAMQAELACAHKMFLWSTIWGKYGNETGVVDGFSTVMEILYRRLQGLPPALDSACIEMHQHQVDQLEAIRRVAGAGSGSPFAPLPTLYDGSRRKPPFKFGPGMMENPSRRNDFNHTACLEGQCWQLTHDEWPPGGAVCGAYGNRSRPCV